MSIPDHKIFPTGAPKGTKACQSDVGCAAVFDSENVYLDTASGRILCHSCGPRMRYHRKKALGRGESIPITFKEVDDRLSQPPTPAVRPTP